MQVGGVTKGIWPKGNADRLQPALACVKKLLPSALGQVSDGSLRYSILKVGIDPAEGELLIALLAHHFEVVVGKSTNVTVAMWILTPCWAANRSNACLASIVSNKLRLLVMR